MAKAEQTRDREDDDLTRSTRGDNRRAERSDSACREEDEFPESDCTKRRNDFD